MSPDFEQSGRWREPFHGEVWVHVSRERAKPAVRLVISLARSWDIDLRLAPADAVALAEALDGADLHIMKGETSDGEAAVVVAERDRLAVVVPRERLCDVLTLGEQAKAVQEWLRVAGQPDGQRPGCSSRGSSSPDPRGR